MRETAAPLHTFEMPNHPSLQIRQGRIRGDWLGTRASYHDSAEQGIGTRDRRLHSVAVRGTKKKRGQSICVGMRCPAPHNKAVAGSGRPGGGLRPNRPMSV